MIVVKIFGGLGNQMFQYAAGRALSESNARLYLDTQFYTTDTAGYYESRRYELGLFKNINARFASKWMLTFFLGGAAHHRLFRKVFGRLIQYLHYPAASYKALAPQIKARHVYVDGYFQSEKYFNHKRDVILKDFTFPPLDRENQLIASKIRGELNPVSIHIRRGDYLHPNLESIHGVLPLTYYHDALDILRSRYNNLVVFVFSDDIPWAKTHLQTNGIETFFIENNNSIDSWKDMSLMSKCRHHIIANSSFSWWGAWLNPREDKIVIAPKKWFTSEQLNLNTEDLIPANWIKI